MGNVFEEGATVAVELPTSSAPWTLTDYDSRVLRTVPAGTRRIELGTLGVGFYRLRQSPSQWVSLAVVAKRRGPVSKTSPIGIDIATTWFYTPEEMPTAMHLCQLARVSQVRDRMRWDQLETSRGTFAPPMSTRNDVAAKLQSAAGFGVLQVNHSTPAWAQAETNRFPIDLRDAYRFYQTVAKRWKGQVTAFEPWNEADIGGFGGHTGAEVAAMQKASFLGLKSGNPHVTVCENVFAYHNIPHLQDLDANEAWPYFDTYNLHHYEPIENYPKLYADHRAVSAGRPMWVSEFAKSVLWSGDSNLKELDDATMDEQSERIAKVHATALNEGPRALFYFILPHYSEGQIQFGLVRLDMTPRASYVAFAAVGRFLADARAVGRVTTDTSIQAYAFRSKPDGESRTVVVAWREGGPGELPAVQDALAVFDHLGRPLARTTRIDKAPRYFVLPARARPAVTAAPPTPKWRPGKASPIVLQAVLPASDVALPLSAYSIAPIGTTAVPVSVYNFGPTARRVRLTVKAPKGWRVSIDSAVEVAPMGRRNLTLNVDPLGNLTGASVETVSVRGDDGSVVSLRFAPTR